MKKNILIFLDVDKMNYFSLESWDSIKQSGGLKSITLELNRDYDSIYLYDCIRNIK